LTRRKCTSVNSFLKIIIIKIKKKRIKTPKRKRKKMKQKTKFFSTFFTSITSDIIKHEYVLNPSVDKNKKLKLDKPFRKKEGWCGSFSAPNNP